MNKFSHLAACKITGDKQLVVSQKYNGMVSIAQKAEVTIDGVKTEFFIKNAIVVDAKGLDNIIDTLVMARRSLTETMSEPEMNEQELGDNIIID